ncbi:MAG: YcxB family protein, partial [Clostridia bacterium]|nr:YcxB family protein [Clostridia bacterium]
IPGIIFIMIPWRTWQVTLAQMQLPAFAFGVTYTFSQHKITLDVGESKEEMPWDLFIQIKETKNDFRFFVDTVRAQLIPKHNFSKEELGVFKRIAAQATEKEVCKFK